MGMIWIKLNRELRNDTVNAESTKTNDIDCNHSYLDENFILDDSLWVWWVMAKEGVWLTQQYSENNEKWYWLMFSIMYFQKNVIPMAIR